MLFKRFSAFQFYFSSATQQHSELIIAYDHGPAPVNSPCPPPPHLQSNERTYRCKVKCWSPRRGYWKDLLSFSTFSHHTFLSVSEAHPHTHRYTHSYIHIFEGFFCATFMDTKIATYPSGFDYFSPVSVILLLFLLLKPYSYYFPVLKTE